MYLNRLAIHQASKAENGIANAHEEPSEYKGALESEGVS